MATMKKGNDHNKLKDSHLDLKLSFNLIYPRLNLHPYRSHSNLTCLVQVFYLFGGEGEASFLTVEGLVVSSFFTGSVLSLGFPVNKIYYKKLKYLKKR